MILKLCLQASAYILFFFSLHFKLPTEHLHLAALQVPQTQGVKEQSQRCFPKVSQYLCCGCSAAQQCLTLCDLWTAAHQASLSISNSRSLLKLISTESVMPFNHLILCHPLLLLPSTFPSIRVFSNESALHIK